MPCSKPIQSFHASVKFNSHATRFLPFRASAAATPVGYEWQQETERRRRSTRPVQQARASFTVTFHVTYGRAAPSLQEGSTTAVSSRRTGASAGVPTSFDGMGAASFRELKDGGTWFFEGVAGGATRMVGSMHALQAAAPTAAAVAPALTACVQSHHEDGGLSRGDTEILR